MTIGIGGWGSRRKPMALVRAIARSPLKNLTIVSYAGPDVGLLVASGQAKRIVTGFASLDSIALEPHFRRARQDGTVELTELDEGMLHWGLLAAAHRLPFLPIRAGLRSGVLEVNPELRTIRSPYGDPFGIGEELVAMPALRLDAALVHMNRADAAGNGQYLGPDPYFDDLFCLAAERAYVSCEQIVPSLSGPPQTLLLNRAMVHAVAETPNGAHFTSCVPDYGRDEAFQAHYARAAADPEEWQRFRAEYLDGDEASLPAGSKGAHQVSGPRGACPPKGSGGWSLRGDGSPQEQGGSGGIVPPEASSGGLRGGLRRGVARRRRDPGQPDGADPVPGRPAGPAHVRARFAADRRRGVPARRRRPGGGLAAVRQGVHDARGGPQARDDGRGADRPVREPEHLLHRRLEAPEGPAARRARRAGQHGEPPGQLLDPAALAARLHQRCGHGLRRRLRPG